MVSKVLGSFPGSQNPSPVFFPVRSIRISENPGVSAHSFKMAVATAGKENGGKKVFSVFKHQRKVGRVYKQHRMR